ncbi:MAG TPA: hypothetical protein VFT65_03660 [Candidatus Angelobacter sp.]|nr:hypothetical protein [Candidatus Angelobacter sp.]
MEITLNLVWAGLAATLLALWYAGTLAPPDRRRSTVALLALVCAICILFPVVSMTDDLSASPAEPETVASILSAAPDFVAAGNAWVLVYDPHTAPFHHEVEAQPDYAPPSHSYFSFFLTRRPPPQFA